MRIEILLTSSEGALRSRINREARPAICAHRDPLSVPQLEAQVAGKIARHTEVENTLLGLLTTRLQAEITASGTTPIAKVVVRVLQETGEERLQS